MVNVGTYTIHGWYGYWDSQIPGVLHETTVDGRVTLHCPRASGRFIPWVFFKDSYCTSFSGWWFQPLWKILVKYHEHKKSLKPPPRSSLLLYCFICSQLFVKYNNASQAWILSSKQPGDSPNKIHVTSMAKSKFRSFISVQRTSWHGECSM